MVTYSHDGTGGFEARQRDHSARGRASHKEIGKARWERRPRRESSGPCGSGALAANPSARGRASHKEIGTARWERRPRRESFGPLTKSFGPRAGLPQGNRQSPVGAPPSARIFVGLPRNLRPEAGLPQRWASHKKPSARGGPPTEERHPDHEPPPTGRPAVRGAHPTPARPSERVAYHAPSSLRSCRLLEELPSGQSDDDEVARIGRANPCVVASRRNEVPRGTAPLAGS